MPCRREIVRQEDTNIPVPHEDTNIPVPGGAGAGSEKAVLPQTLELARSPSGPRMGGSSGGWQQRPNMTPGELSGGRDRSSEAGDIPDIYSMPTPRSSLQGLHGAGGRGRGSFSDAKSGGEASTSQCDSESGEDAQRRAKLYKYAGSSPAVKKKISKRAMLRGSGMALSDVENLNKLLSSSLKELDVTSREKYRSDAVQYGMKLLDEERKRSDEEYSVLVRRIEFLTRELEESKRVQVIKSRECEELLEVAEELARGGVGIIDQSSQSISTTSPGASTPRRNWLQSPDTSLLSPGSSSLFDSPMSGRRRGEIEIPESGTPRGLQTKAGERGCRACSMGGDMGLSEMFMGLFRW